jgi:hypothetical protein
MEKRDILDYQGIKVGEMELPSGTSEETWQFQLAMYSRPPIVIPISVVVQSKILDYRKTADKLLTELYSENTLAGISVAESDALFDEYQDIILRIQQGAFPTALYRLSQKTPSGFVTQDLLDKWSSRIRDYL